ncbi:MAG: thiamine pyrophosphate-dependent dehydrogenase E1 component subunit alpha [Aldersonia sp.]|nr:thiamine pyrophosphate-dependent dehydrogenase E1 component subunit alpha [Aldersonia sp.]
MGAQPVLEQLYRQMCRIRYVEQAISELWRAGLVSGEMHLGIGEEAVAAGVVAHIEDGDALSVDYRSTPPFVARGVDPEAIFREILGDERGLDGGRAGHMHLMSRRHLAAATGIVGASAPVACGFGLAAALGDRKRIAVAFFGDGAVNEGMLMESLNLAAVWALPIVFVCKDNRWAVTTRSKAMTAGGLRRRVRGFGIPMSSVDGTDVEAVWRVAKRAVSRARAGRGPSVIVARVQRSEGHFIGDKLLDVATHPRVLVAEVRRLLREVRVDRGAPVSARLRSLSSLTRTMGLAALDPVRSRRDPLARARRRLPSYSSESIEQAAHAEITAALAVARAGLVGAHA